VLTSAGFTTPPTLTPMEGSTAAGMTAVPTSGTTHAIATAPPAAGRHRGALHRCERPEQQRWSGEPLPQQSRSWPICSRCGRGPDHLHHDVAVSRKEPTLTHGLFMTMKQNHGKVETHRAIWAFTLPLIVFICLSAMSLSAQTLTFSPSGGVGVTGPDAGGSFHTSLGHVYD